MILDWFKAVAWGGVAIAIVFAVIGAYGVAVGSDDDCTEAFRAVCRAVRCAK